MSTFVMGGISPLDFSNGIYLMLIFFALLFVVCACAVATLLKGNISRRIGRNSDTDGEYPVGEEATLPEPLCLMVIDARESRK